MAILDFYNNPALQDELAPGTKQDLLSIFNSGANAQAPTSSMLSQLVPQNYQAPTSQSDAQQVAQVNQAENSEAADTRGFGQKLADLFTDGAFLDSARAFGASASGDTQGFAQSMNSYSQRMDSRRQEAAQKAAQAKAEARYQDETNYSRARDKQAFDSSLATKFTPESIQAYMQSGDSSSLVVKPEEMTEYQRQSLDLQRQNHADSVALQRQRLSQSGGSGSGSTGAVSTVNGSGVANGNNEFGAYKNSAGQWVVSKTYANGRTVETLVGPQQAKMLDDKVAKDGLGATEKLTFDNINKGIELAQDPETQGGINGTGVIGNGIKNLLGPGVANVIGSTANDKTRQLNAIADQVDGQLQNIGISQAKANGASGINTLAEVKQYASSLPWIDRSSPERLVATMSAAQNFLANNAKQDRNDRQDSIVPAQLPAENSSTPAARAPARTAPKSSSGWSISRVD